MTGAAADRQLAAWLRMLPEYSEPDLATLRAAGAERARLRPRGPDMARVADIDAAGVPVRLYVPEGEPPTLLVYLHGGGWTIGSVETHDSLCRVLASQAGVRVVSVEYRLAPEHRWPASVDDSATVLQWAASAPAELGPAPDRVAVGGDSAGGTLTALACLRLRDEAPDALPDLQVMLCPNTDLAADTESMREKRAGWGLDAEIVQWFAQQWLGDAADPADPRVSPLRATDLRDLPPALILTAEHDVLRDEGEAFAAALSAAGVEVAYRCEPGLVHGFVTLADVSPACAAARERVCDDVRRMLARSRPRARG